MTSGDDNITDIAAVRKNKPASITVEIFLPDDVDAILELLHLAAKYSWKLEMGETE